MYISNGDKHIWFVNPSFEEEYKFKELRPAYTVRSSAKNMFMTSLVLWLFGGIFLLAGSLTSILFLSLGAAFVLGGAIERIVRRRTYRRLVAQGRAIDLASSLVGRGLRALLFAGFRNVKPSNEMTVFAEVAYNDNYTLQRTLDKFLSTQQNLDLLKTLGGMRGDGNAQARLLAVLGSRAEELIELFRPFISKMQKSERKSKNLERRFDDVQLSWVFTQYGLHEDDATKDQSKVDMVKMLSAMAR